MKTTIYLLRHGESLGNVKKRFLGQSNWDLTPTGYRQAQLTARALSDLPLDVICSSDLIRAWHTAEPIAADHHLPIHPVPGFREINAGQWETHPFSQLQTCYAQAYACWQTDLAHACPTGGESVAQLYDRVFEALCQVEKTYRGQSILIATHATPIRVLMARLSGGLPAVNDIAWVSNASVTKVECRRGKWTLLEANDATHLGTLYTTLPAII